MNDSEKIVEWLKSRCASLRSRDFLAALSDADVVGFGDPTHGTREFYIERYRLLKRLVVDMGFRALAIEASFAATAALNDYVAGGAGDLAQLVSGLRALMWDVEEFVAAIGWMRNYNLGRDPTDQVRLYGLDIWNTAVGREHVLHFLERWVPEKYDAARAAFESISSAESKGILGGSGHFDRALYQEVQSLLDCLVEKSAWLTARTSSARLQEVQWHLRVVRQWVAANLQDEESTCEEAAGLPRVRGLNYFLRSRFLADNLLELIKEHRPSTKWMVWAHIYHVGIGIFDEEHGIVSNMGATLRSQLGGRYRVIGFEFESGAYLGRPIGSDGGLGGFGIVTVPSAPPETLPWYLGRLGSRRCFLDLRENLPTPAAECWLNGMTQTHAMGWVYGEQPHLYADVRIGGYYDGIVFFRRTSPTRPTQSARARIADPSAH